MTKREAQDLARTTQQLQNLGISWDDCEALRRISLTLRRWFEQECGTGNGCIERDETTGKAYWRSGAMGVSRWPIADKETGARKRLAKIMDKYPTLVSYVQGDPRGCALYVLAPEHLADGHTIDSIYNRGIAIG